jgi:hypothetical protein
MSPLDRDEPEPVAKSNQALSRGSLLPCTQSIASELHRHMVVSEEFGTPASRKVEILAGGDSVVGIQLAGMRLAFGPAILGSCAA